MNALKRQTHLQRVESVGLGANIDNRILIHYHIFSLHKLILVTAVIYCRKFALKLGLENGQLSPIFIFARFISFFDK